MILQLLPYLFNLEALIAIVIIAVISRIYARHLIKPYEGKETLHGKTVVITGANAGIGKATALDLAQRGARVIMLCRDICKAYLVKEKIKLACQNPYLIIKIKKIDFSELSSVRQCAAEILKEEQHIDILVNNAGATMLGMNKKTSDGLEVHMQTNHFGPFLLTNLLLDLIKKAPAGRIVNLTSEAYRFAKLDLKKLDMSNAGSEFRIYSNSKLANIWFTLELARKLIDTNVTVNCVHPGLVASEISRNHSWFFNIIWKPIVYVYGKSNEEGAQTTIYACVSPSLRNTTGKYLKECSIVQLKGEAVDMWKARSLWSLSKWAVHLKPHERHY